MSKRVYTMCLALILTLTLAGCGAKEDLDDDNYADYSVVETTADTDDVTTAETIEEETSTSEETSATDVISESEDASQTTTDNTTTTVSGAVTTAVTTTNTKSATTTATTTSKKSTTNSNNSNQNNDNNNNQNVGYQEAVQEPSNDNQQNVAVEPEPTGSFDGSDMYLTYNGCTLSVDANMNDIEGMLGSPNSIDVSPSCYYDGDDKIYYYNDINVYTYTFNGVDYYAQEIELTTSNVSTAKGIHIGSSLSDMESVYGTGYQLYGSEYRYYASENTYLYFWANDGGTIENIGYVIDMG